MKPIRHLALITLLLTVASLHAREEALVSGGESPDKQFRIVVIESQDKDEQPSAYFRHVPTNKIVGAHFVGSFANYLGAQDPINAEVAWSPDSHYAAIKSRSTKRSSDVTIYRVSKLGSRAVKTANYFQRILRSLGAPEVERYSFEKPLRWKSPTEVIIDVTGDCFIGPRDAANYRSFHYHVTIDASNGKTKSIKQLELKNEGG